MGIFRRKSAAPEPLLTPTPFVAEVLRRVGEAYGGFDAMSPLSAADGGPGMDVVIHIAGPPVPGREAFMHGTGIMRTARVTNERTVVFAGDQLIASFDDLTTAHLFGEAN